MAGSPTDIFCLLAIISTIQRASVVHGQTTKSTTKEPDVTSITFTQFKHPATTVIIDGLTTTTPVITDNSDLTSSEVPKKTTAITSTGTITYSNARTLVKTGSRTEHIQSTEVRQRRPDITSIKFNQSKHPAPTVTIDYVTTSIPANAGAYVALGIGVAAILSFILIGLTWFFYRRSLKQRDKSRPNDVGKHHHVDVVYENETASYENDTTLYENGTTLYENGTTTSRFDNHVYQNQKKKGPGRAAYVYDYAKPIDIQTQSNIRQKGINAIKMSEILSARRDIIRNEKSCNV